MILGKASLASLALGLLVCGSALGCSICRCGDPTFNALGNEGVPQSGFRVALDWDRLEKSQGSAATGDLETLTEERLTLLAAYAASERVAIFARVPYSWRDLREAEDGEVERSKSSGFADPEVYGQIRLWSSAFEGDVGQRASLFAVVGVKTDLGKDNLQRGGERADEHVQPGTGSNDLFGGLAGSYQLNPQSALFASFQYRSTGRNDASYRYGNVWLANLAFERKLSPRLDSAIELNYRHTDRDSVDRFDVRDDNTGGSIAFVTPRVLFNIAGGWVARVSVQLPLSQRSLNGSQDEDPVINLGVTYLIGR